MPHVGILWYNGIMRKGFTIIEVALVLAIAGLIFAMVFTALPALWASERDSERRDDMLTFIDTLKNFQTNNNRGALPYDTPAGGETTVLRLDGDSIKPLSVVDPVVAQANTWKGFYTYYFPESFQDADGVRYNWAIMTCFNQANKLDAKCENSSLTTLYEKTFAENNYTMYIVVAGTCYGEEVQLSANARKVAVLYKLESGGNFCGNS